MVAAAKSKWGRIDILVNNAGILRDKTFAKMELGDFRAVLEVHLMGSVHCCKAVWEPMREQNYGRIVLTTSSSGLFGNFGQSNYSAAKMGLVGLMQTLGLEGEKYNVRVNCLAPTAATRMTDNLMPPEVLALMKPEAVSPAVLAMVAEDAPNRAILNAGANGFERTYVVMTHGVNIPLGPDTPDQVAARLDEISDRDGATLPQNAGGQGAVELAKAGSPKTTRK
jgi:NAD(P)-dependent dehydrogenase (short-subunit alcohol dehydrogenase family)